MVKPGLSRAIPAAILGAFLGALIVYFLRSAQSMVPVWDANVALVLIPWVMCAAFLWGMGGFNPKMSAHAHGPEPELDIDETALVAVESEHAIVETAKHDDHHHEEEPPRPFAIFSAQIWTVTTITLAALVSLFAFALLPHGLLLRTTGDAFADTAGFATNANWSTPLGIPVGEGGSTFQADELTVFLGFFAFTMISLFVMGGGIAFLFYFLNQQVAEAKAQPAVTVATGEPTPLVPAGVARVSGRIARALRNGLPKFFGQ